MPRPASPGALVRAMQNTLERRIQNSRQEAGLQQSRFLIRTIIWVLLGTSGAAIAWLSLAQTEEIIVAPGKLEPMGEVSTIQMPVGGVLKQMLVKEGEKVRKGQVLLRLDSEALRSKDQELRQSLNAKEKQLMLKELELNRYLDINSREQLTARKNLSLEKTISTRLSKLQKMGALAELQSLQQINKVQQAEGELERLRMDRRRQIAILGQQIQALKTELADIRAKRSESNMAMRYQDVHSPVNGVIFNMKPTGPGFVAQGSEPVMQVVPFDRLRAAVEINSDKIGFVHKGQQADISIDSFPASDFGVLKGAVTQVGSDALPPDQLNQTYRFPAIISLQDQQLKLRSGKALPLQAGMSLTANIKLRKVTYLQLLLSSMRDKSESLRKL
jgi:HlyD family secretion protein